MVGLHGAEVFRNSLGKQKDPNPKNFLHFFNQANQLQPSTKRAMSYEQIEKCQCLIYQGLSHGTLIIHLACVTCPQNVS